MYNLDEYHSSRRYCAEQFQQKIYSLCLITAVQLCEIWGIYIGEKAYCSHRVMKPYSLVGSYQHFKVTYVINSVFLQNGDTHTLLHHKMN